MDSSLEKAERARAGVRIAVWNESSSWLGPLREYARISSTIRPGVCPEPLKAEPRSEVTTPATAGTLADTTDRRIRFLGWEITTLIETHRTKAKSASELLNTIFFRELGFNVCTESSARRLDGPGALFETVLARRCGPPTLISIIYAWIGELVSAAYGDESDFLRVEIVQSCPTDTVRLIPRDDCGTIWLVSLSGGTKVGEEIWSEWVSLLTSIGFVRLTWAQGLVRSLTELFRILERTPSTSIDFLSAELYVLDQIINLQPSETSRWAERAMLNSRRGDRSSALDDLKRFFAFHERESAPAAIVSLFDDLRGRDLN